MTLGGVSDAVSGIEVVAGTLRLSAPFVPTTAVVRAEITNSSFEDHAAISAGTYLTGWRRRVDHHYGGIIRQGGITQDRVTTPWVAQGSIPDGESAVFFQYDGGIQTTVTVCRGPACIVCRFRRRAVRQRRLSETRFRRLARHAGNCRGKNYDPVFKRFEYRTPP
jgi:hypothetical protein